MTFSIVGHCSETGELGIAISSSSIAVGARCVWTRAGVGVVATQNVTLPAHGNTVLNQLAQGLDPAAALAHALATDPHQQHRQVSVVDRQGRTALFTGTAALGKHQALAGQQCVAAGNMLADPQVIDAMVQAFEQSTDTLASRLLASLQAGLSAGGEVGPVHSAALQVVGDEVSWPLVDLRVDWADEQAIACLEALWRAYQPQMQDYLTRALNPEAAPSYGVPGDV